MGSDETAVIQDWIDRLRAGDASAREPLLESASSRLVKLARKMLRGYPVVARSEQTDDVLQNALLRLDRALKAVVPPTAREFFRLAAAQIRRELIDLARHYGGPGGRLLRPPGQYVAGPAGDSTDEAELSDATHDPGRLAVWTEFHRQVESLGEDERDAFDLLWYQGLSQAEAAAVLGVSERTVNRRWIAARLRLRDALGDRIPT